jgi:putative transposase
MASQSKGFNTTVTSGAASSARRNAAKRRQFLFRRDPRDISVVHFWDPDLRRYSAVLYRNIAHPPMSVWELRELRRRLHESGTAQIDEVAIFAAYERLRDREARAATETKRVRLHASAGRWAQTRFRQMR